MVMDSRLRKGIRIRGNRGNPVVSRAIVRYAKWLRCHQEFPIRVPVYLLPGKMVKLLDGGEASASFFAPYSRKVEPYIRIATGDYSELRKKYGRDDALASFIVSLSHEVIHYEQWWQTGKTWERGVPSKAVKMLRAYAKTVRIP